MKRLLSLTLLISVCSLLFLSCKKGDAGPAGADGATGPIGPIGPVGPVGSANVIYSAWITSPYASRDTTIDGTCVRVRHLDAPKLTATILSQGMMMTYFRVGSIGPYQLPYVADAGGATNQVNCIYGLNKIFVFRHTYNSCRFTSAVAASYAGEPVMINLPQSLEYRYILIPGAQSGRGVNGQTQNYSAEQLAGMSYEKVLELFNIPEQGSNQ